MYVCTCTCTVYSDWGTHTYMYMNEVIKSPELNVVCYKMHVHMYASSSMQILFGIRLEDREKHVPDISIWEHI